MTAVYVVSFEHFFQVKKSGVFSRHMGLERMVNLAAFLSAVLFTYPYYFETSALFFAIIVIAIIFLLLVFSLFSRIRKLSVYNTSILEVEEVVDEIIENREIMVEKREDSYNKKIRLLVKDTNEKIELHWDVSPLNDDFNHTVNLSIKTNPPSEMDELWIDLKEKLREIGQQKSHKKRLFWSGSVFIGVHLAFLYVIFGLLL